eukprot:5123839-Lingulodinium_polyedra.AAC.1
MTGGATSGAQPGPPQGTPARKGQSPGPPATGPPAGSAASGSNQAAGAGDGLDPDDAPDPWAQW